MGSGSEAHGRAERAGVVDRVIFAQRDLTKSGFGDEGEEPVAGHLVEGTAEPAVERHGEAQLLAIHNLGRQPLQRIAEMLVNFLMEADLLRQEAL